MLNMMTHLTLVRLLSEHLKRSVMSAVRRSCFTEGDDQMYECFHCGERAVIWDCDFSFEDYGYEGDGIVQECHCTHCGASITYMIPFPETNEEGEDSSDD